MMDPQYFDDWYRIGMDVWSKLKKELEMSNKKIEIELPEPPPAGGYASCPSGDTEYEEALDKWHEKVNALILKAVPRGYNLKSSEIKQTKVVRNYAVVEVEKR